jgi:hypothetical protein
MAEQIAKPIRTFEAITYLTAPIMCESMDDLTPQMQDQVMKALEEISDKVELPLQIVAIRCDKDYDSTDPQKVWYLHILASEVVIGIDRGSTLQ